MRHGIMYLGESEWANYARRTLLDDEQEEKNLGVKFPNVVKLANLKGLKVHDI